MVTVLERILDSLATIAKEAQQNNWASEHLNIRADGELCSALHMATLGHITPSECADIIAAFDKAKGYA